MADLANLKQKRARAQGTISRIKNYALSIPVDADISDIQARVHKLSESFREFCGYDDQIAVVPNEASHIEAVEEIFFSAEAALQRHMHNTTPRPDDANNPLAANLDETLHVIASQNRHLLDALQDRTISDPQCNLRMPRLTITPFDGKYAEWPSFQDLYKTTVHTNANLTKVQKFQYLKGLLVGEAAWQIRHILVTEENYDTAWDKLVERYDRKKQIINNYIKTFFEQPQIKHTSASELRRLADTSDEIIRGLETICTEAKGRDPWLIFILLQKTDEETRQQWATKVSDKKFHSFEDFIKFVNEKCDALESYSFHTPLQSQHTFASESQTSCKSTSISAAGRCPKCSGNHPLFKCSNFKALPVAERRQLVLRCKLCFNCLHEKHQTSSCSSSFRCHYCNGKHHSSLHQPEPIQSHHAADRCQKNPNQNSYKAIKSNNISSKSSIQTKQSILPTAIVYVQNKFGALRPCRALLDSGSMATFISESCLQRLDLERTNQRSTISGLSSTEVATSKGIVSLQIQTDEEQFLHATALILNKITSPIPSTDISTSSWPWIHDNKLADPFFYKSQDIDILIGADYFFQVLQEERIQHAPQDPILQKTVFGWVVAGQHHQVSDPCNISYSTQVSLNIDKALNKFWELETVPSSNSHLTEEEMYCETHFKTHLRIDSDGRYVVRLPFVDSTQKLGNSKRTATSCLLALERRLAKNPSLRIQYNTFMQEYLKLRHMKDIPPSLMDIADNEGFYLPHHAVLKPSSKTTKVRVVFNASRKTSSNVSLNDVLGVGPTIQRDLFSILVNFRQFRIPISADIAKMYRQIRLDPKDWNYQRILWRENPSERIQDFWLTTVTYGTSPAPFLATRALHEIANECEHDHPHIANIIKNQFYVDDLLTGAENPEDATSLRVLLEHILSSRGFELRKWKSNCQLFIDGIPADSRDIESIDFNCEPTKLLGLYWNPSNDCFTFRAVLTTQAHITKRTILSEASKIFDPLGLLSPATISIKILFQRLWLEQADGRKLNWDDDVPEPLAVKWRAFMEGFGCFEDIKVPRWIHSNDISKCEFHGFCDASEAAYSAVIYCRSSAEDKTCVNIVASKTRVAPLKQQSLPRLELCGAVLLASLFKSVQTAFGNQQLKLIYAWTDSKIVLSWLNAHPKRWKTFVANRTSTILNTIPAELWRHVPSQDNPADMASRGVSPQTLSKSAFWWQGPSWLCQSENMWPAQESSITYRTNREEKQNIIQAFPINSSNSTWDAIFARASSFKKVIRIVAYWQRYISNIRSSKVRQRASTSKKKSFPFSVLTTCELKEATFTCLRWVQTKEFEEELKFLKSKKQIPNKSKISSLFPYIDGCGLLRVGGRLESSLCSYDAKHPIILPKQHIVTSLLIHQYHEQYLHPGPTLLLSIMRQKYWIIGGRSTIRHHIHRCLKCFRLKRTKQEQLMGSLPENRVQPSRPFLHCGIDYAGPIKVRLNKGRGAKTSKGYIAVFVCFSTKAIHVDLVSDLTADAFIATLKRFIARRGVPSGIYSDNGTNFVGAKRKLSDVYKLVLSRSYNDLITNFLSQSGTKWHLIPPASPHFGGLWESGVKSIKTHLKRVIGETVLTFEEMTTLLTQIEAVLNSRPLSSISDSDVSCLDTLTPGHFLIGAPLTALPEIDVTNTNVQRLNRWQQVQRMVQSYWKQWSRDYLHTLNQRSKWRNNQKNIAVNDLVLIHDDNLPPTAWLVGRVISVHPGRDDKVRAVTLRTRTGEIKRPIVKIAKLPLD